MSKNRPIQQSPQPGARRVRRGALLGALVLAAGGASFLFYSRFILVFEVHSGVRRITDLPLVEETWRHPRLQLLRSREKLDKVIAPGRSPFQKLVLLRRWARAQWPPGKDFYYPPWDALEILDLARRHRNHGFCAQYAIVFVQACQAMGRHTRYVDLGHFVAEVWSNEYDKWVVMDPTQDVHFEKGGVPMNGIELSRAAWKSDPRGISVVGSDGVSKPAAAGDIAPYRQYSILLVNNQLTEPVPVRVNGVSRRLAIEKDHRSYPRTDKDVIVYENRFLAWKESPGQPEMPDKDYSDDPDDFDDAFNQTLIRVANRNPAKAIVKVKLLAEQTPGFQSFVKRFNGETRDDAKDELVLYLKPGMNTFGARVKNDAGWLGPESSIRVYFKPRWSVPRL